MPNPTTAPLRHAPAPSSTQNLRGIVFMALGFFAFAAGDMQAKLLTDDMHALQIVWFRQSGLFLGVLVLLALRGTHILRSVRPSLQIGRGVVAVISACCFVIGIKFVPLADAVAVTFVAPFIVTILGALLLREPVGPRRWAAVAIGFLGMLIVIRPGMGVFHPAILLVLVAATAFAARQILSRWLAGADPIATTVAYTSITSTFILTLSLPFVWTTPADLKTWAIVIGLTLSASTGEVLVIRALDIAQAVVLAPLHYTLIIWGTFYGFFIFADLPDFWTLLGCAIIVGSGLYTLHRERLAAKSAG